VDATSVKHLFLIKPVDGYFLSHSEQ